jgi:hypothetical protein
VRSTVVDSALFDFAEAAMGKNTEMNWSLSPAVLRRQISPVFNLCAAQELTAEEALDVAMEFVAARVTNMLEVFQKLFDTLSQRIDVQMHGVEFPALLEIEEFLLGLHPESQWATDKGITRRELHYLFEKVYAGEYSSRTGVAVFCDTVMSKKDYLLDLVQTMCLGLTQQIVDARKAQEPATSDPEGPERMANGDD